MSNLFADYKSLRERASAVIGAGPLAVHHLKARNDELKIRESEHKPARCPVCGKLAAVESPCISVLSGQAVQYLRCQNKHCKHTKNLL